ncbi:hypothetical protein [Nocardia sp. XZ_19_385]|uniref:hypothetical protein n=1 Tax=Nocardia sp. XZ_19_385 TaxID=2769488 RepID=UPI00188EA8DD|nr:hypothetical protein [Nocardia sp. XZ_19_385]
MTEYSEISARLAALPDAELTTVLQAATVGRPAFWAVRAALDEMAGVGHIAPGGDVSPTTESVQTHDQASGGGASGQVGAASAVPVVPVHPAGIPASPAAGGYSSGGVPTFESVRDKVEQRFGTAQGMGELDRQTPAGRSADEQWEAREKAARERLDQIRKSVHDNDNP